MVIVLVKTINMPMNGIIFAYVNIKFSHNLIKNVPQDAWIAIPDITIVINVILVLNRIRWVIVYALLDILCFLTRSAVKIRNR